MYNLVENPWDLVLRAAPYTKRMLLHSEDPGTGKTSFGVMLAEFLGYDCTIITMNDSMVASDLYGHMVNGKGGETQWHDGPLTRAVRKGRTVIVCNEIPNGGADVQHVFYSALETGKSAKFVLPSGEVLSIPDTLVFVGTQNPDPADTMTPAVRQRWQVCIDIKDHVSPMILNALPDSLRSMVADHRMASREAFAILELIANGCDTMIAIQAVLGTQRADDYGDALAVALSTGTEPAIEDDSDDSEDEDECEDEDEYDSEEE